MATRDPHVVAASADQTSQITSRAIQGDSSSRIARDLSIPLATVRQVLKLQATRIREQSQDRAAVRYLRHDEILTRLIEATYKELLLSFCKDRMQGLIRLLERQARLLGIDQSKALGNDQWLAEQSDEELVQLAESRYGIRVPRELLAPSRN